MRKTTNPRVIMSDEVEARRADIVVAGDQCDNRLPHAPHSRQFIMAKWLGGGTECLACSGVK